MRNWQLRFFSIWTGQAFSLLGSRLVSFALIWWLTEQTGSEAVLVTATSMTLLPPILLGPFAGALVDRWSRRTVMIVADACIALFTAALAFLFWRGAEQLWHLYAVMALRALGSAFHEPAMMASTALMVPEEHLTRVAGMNQTLAGVLRIVAPPLGAVLLGLLPLQGILAIDVFTALLAISPLLCFAIPRPRPSADAGPTPSLLRDVAAGLRYVWGWRGLFLVVATCALANIFLGPLRSFLPLLVNREFGGEALKLGFVTSAQGIGIIAGGFFMSVWGGFRRRLVTSAVGWIGVGLALVTVALTPGPWFNLLLAAMLAGGFANSVGCAPLNAFYQSCVAPDKQGRVFAVLGAIDQITMPLGLLLAGLLGSRVPLRAWWWLVGLSHAALGVLWLLSPNILRAEDEAGPAVATPEETLATAPERAP